MTALLVLVCTLAASDAPSLSVLYVGNDGTPRAASYVELLSSHFDKVGSASRKGFDPAMAADYDVVLLDWSQSDENIGDMASIRSPLGSRESWTKPTVLLDSAGLLIASEWETTGSYG